MPDEQIEKSQDETTTGTTTDIPVTTTPGHETQKSPTTAQGDATEPAEEKEGAAV